MKKLLILVGSSAICATGALAEGTEKTDAQTGQPILSTNTFDGTIPLIPKGYRLAWTDDRLNPLRGVGTAEGEAQMNLIWTTDIPRKLIVN